jgi:hypothetical protein
LKKNFKKLKQKNLKNKFTVVLGLAPCCWEHLVVMIRVIALPSSEVFEQFSEPQPEGCE